MDPLTPTTSGELLNATGWETSTEAQATDFCNSGVEDKQELHTILKILSSFVVAIIMVGIGCSIKAEKAIKHLRKPTGIVIGVICQFVLMPVLACVWAKIFQMENPETLSVLIMGSCPGGTTSNIAAYWIGGDMELSAVMTTVSVTLSLGMMPLLLYIYSLVFTASSLVVPFDSLGIALALIIVPLTAGALINYKFPSVALKILRISGVVGIVAIIVLAGISVPTFYCYWHVEVGQIVTAVCLPLTGAAAGYLVSSLLSVTAKPLYLHHYQRRTISAETGIQNTQIATAIIQLSGWSLETTGRIVIFPILYALTQVIWCIIFIIIFRIYTLIRNQTGMETTSYQANEATQNRGAELGEPNLAFETVIGEA